jgi:predicted DNA binding protein
MSVIAEIQVEGDFVLSELLTELPEVRIQFERIVPAGERTVPLIWIHTADPDPVEQALREHELISSITQLDRFEDRALYRIEWVEQPGDIFEEIRAQRADLLDAVGIGESWKFELRFPSHDTLSDFHARCRAAGLPLTVNRIYRPSETDSGVRYGLTDRQYDTLLRALEQGYFAIPREVSAEELATQFNISDQAVTERIRRGLTNVLTHILVTPDELREP